MSRVPSRPRPWHAGSLLARYRPSRYVPIGALWAATHILPVVGGVILKAVFDRLTPGASVRAPLLLLALFAAFETGRAFNFWLALAGWPGWWQYCCAWLRANALWSILAAPGSPSARLPGSAGETVGRLRDDVEDLVWFADIWVDVAGGVVFTALALVIMWSISALVTLVVIIPLVAVAVATRVLSQLIRRYHNRMRSSGASVTSLVADLFAGALTLKTAGAERAALERFAERNRARGRHAVRAQLCVALLETVSGASVSISIGLVLLLSARAMRSGRFTVGDLALFSTYAAWLGGLPRRVGRMLARSREATVALERLGRLTVPAGPDGVLQHRSVELRLERVPAGPPARSPRTTAAAPVTGQALAAAPEPAGGLRLLEVRGLTVVHPRGSRGVRDATFRLRAGTFTVVTGAVGAGKTTLLRGVLGLLDRAAGEVRWNGVALDDPGQWLVPPRAAYVGQVPRLLSDTLAENLRLGWDAPDAALLTALAGAEFDADLQAMPEGLATIIGPRGSRLSGGQAQRATLARALVRQPQLLVIDDVSSALDVETESRLWAALATGGRTILAVSHRAAALSRADDIVVMADGRVVDQGRAPDLVARSPEFRRLWQGEAFDEAEDELAG